MAGFHRTGHGIEVRLRRPEVAALRQLFTGVVQLLAEPEREPAADPLERLVGLDSAPRERPDDPALARLLPDAYADAESAAEYRRFTERSLREGKVDAARIALATLDDGGRLALDDAQAQAWLSALNDVRLALGARYEVTEDTYDQLDTLAADDPRRPGLEVFGWLGWLQETLVTAVAGW